MHLPLFGLLTLSLSFVSTIALPITEKRDFTQYQAEYKDLRTWHMAYEVGLAGASKQDAIVKEDRLARLIELWYSEGMNNNRLLSTYQEDLENGQILYEYDHEPELRGENLTTLSQWLLTYSMDHDTPKDEALLRMNRLERILKDWDNRYESGDLMVTPELGQAIRGVKDLLTKEKAFLSTSRSASGSA